MSRSTYYATRGRTPRNCYTCDGLHACKCDRVTMRATKRSARARCLAETANDYDEYANNVVLHADGTSRLDYAYDEGERARYLERK